MHSIGKPTLATGSLEGSLASAVRALNTAAVDEASVKCLLWRSEGTGQDTPLLALMLRYIKGDGV
jgi:hypothetical protein